MDSDDFLAAARTADPAAEFPTPNEVGAGAVHLWDDVPNPRPWSSPTTTSPVTSPAPSSSPRRRTSDAALICVPPYHIAGVSAALSILYHG